MLHHLGPSVKYHWTGASILAASIFLAVAAPALGQRCEQNEPTIGFSVRVTDSDSETPLSQVRLDLARFPDELVDTQFTDAKGDTSFFCVIPSSYILRASKDGYEAAEVRVDFRRNESNREIPVQIRRITAEHPQAAGQVASVRTLSIPEGARKEFEAGITFLNEKKDPKSSLEHFRKAIAVYPEYYEAYFLTGMAHLRLKQPDDAQAALAQAIKLNPKFLEPYYPLATLMIAQKHYDEADRLLLRGMELDPRDWQYPFELARLKAEQKRWDQALHYGLAAGKLPTAPSKVHLLLSDIYSNTGQPEKAVQELEAFEKQDPYSAYMPRVREVLSQLRKEN